MFLGSSQQTQQNVSSEDDDQAEHEQGNGTGDTQTQGFFKINCLKFHLFVYLSVLSHIGFFFIAAIDENSFFIVRHPLRRLTGHLGAVMAVEWFNGGEQLVTASWDRLANVYDAERGEILNVLSGEL